MARLTRLKKLLRDRFPEADFELIDDSAAHAGHLDHGGETHYRLRIRDAGFRNKPLLKIHREILTAIKPEIDAGLHSFVIEEAGPKNDS